MSDSEPPPPEGPAHRVLFEQCSARIAHHVKALGAAALDDLSVRDRVEGLRLFASGDRQAAARHFLDAAKLSPAPAPLRLYAFLMGAQGWVGIDGKDPIVVESRLALAQALQEMPLDPFALVCAAIATEDTDPAAAIALYDRALARNPRCVLALYLRGNLRFRMVNTNRFTGGPLKPEAIEETWKRFIPLIEDDFRRVLELDDSLGYRFGIAQFHYVQTFRTLGSVLPLDLTPYHRVSAEYDAIIEAFPDLVQIHSERGGLAYFAADALEKLEYRDVAERELEGYTAR